MAEEKKEGMSYTYGERPDPSLLSPRFTKPGRKWIPVVGPYKGMLGTEYCASSDFKWLGLAFAGEPGYHIFNQDDCSRPN